MKITKDEKRKRKRIRQSMKKGDKRKVKWKKRGERKKRRENSEMNCLFLMVFLLSLSSLKGEGVTWYPTGRREIKLLLLVFELTVSSVFELTVSVWPTFLPNGRNVGHTGETRCWYLVTSDRRTPRGKREKPNDWLGPQNGSGDSFPSAEVNNKKVSFWAGFVAGRRTIASILGWRQKNTWDTRDPRFFKPV